VLEKHAERGGGAGLSGLAFFSFRFSCFWRILAGRSTSIPKEKPCDNLHSSATTIKLNTRIARMTTIDSKLPPSNQSLNRPVLFTTEYIKIAHRVRAKTWAPAFDQRSSKAGQYECCRSFFRPILRYLDNQGRPDHQSEACDAQASELSAELKVIDRRKQNTR
jgi:hypothetical protein